MSVVEVLEEVVVEDVLLVVEVLEEVVVEDVEVVID